MLELYTNSVDKVSTPRVRYLAVMRKINKIHVSFVSREDDFFFNLPSYIPLSECPVLFRFITPPG